MRTLEKINCGEFFGVFSEIKHALGSGTFMVDYARTIPNLFAFTRIGNRLPIYI